MDGDVWDAVYITNDATVNMTGGTIDSYIVAEDIATLNISGGVIREVFGMDNSTVNVYKGAKVGSLDVCIGAGDSSTLNIYGDFGFPEGGLVGGPYNEIYVYDSSVINIYGYDLEKNLIMNPYILLYEGSVTGYWLDGSPLSISLTGGEFANYQINLVPEPASLSLFAFGALALLRRPCGSSLRYGKKRRCNQQG